MAKTLYVSQTGSGTGDGLSEDNRASLAWLNSTANWGAGAGQVGAGDTVSLYGAFTSQLVIAGSGTAGNVVTISFEPGSAFSKAYWGTASSAAVYSSGKSYITIEGNNVGIIENTSNGTALANQQLSCAVNIDGGSNITVRRLIIRNIYVRTANSSDTTGSAGLSIRGISVSSSDNFTAEYNTIDYCKFGIIWDGAGARSSVVVTDNSFSKCSTACAIANSVDSIVSSVTFNRNTVTDGYYWDYVISDVFHNDGLHMWRTGGGSYTSVTIMQNNMLTDWGAWATGAIYLEGSYASIIIANNLLGTSAEKMEGVVNVNGTELLLYGNTIASTSSSSTGGNLLYLQGTSWTNVDAKNNIFYKGYSGVTLRDTQNVSNLHFNYNCYNTLGNVSARLNSSGDQSGSSASISAWATYLGSKGDELNGTSASPSFVSVSNFRLNAGSALINAGATLSNPYNVDVLGTVRPQGLAFDIGAYEFIIEQSRFKRLGSRLKFKVLS